MILLSERAIHQLLQEPGHGHGHGTWNEELRERLIRLGCRQVRRDWTPQRYAAASKWAKNPGALTECVTGIAQRRKYPTFHGKS